MKLLELFIGLIYLIVILLFSYLYANNKMSQNKELKRTFLISLFIKLIFSLLFGIVYQFYYGYGDCIAYLNVTKDYLTYLKIHPSAIFDFIHLNHTILSTNHSSFYNYTLAPPEYFNDSNIMVHRFCLMFGPLSFFSFFSSGLLFALLAFYGSWKIYLTLYEVYPQYNLYIKISFLFLPSVIFWTSGIGKDAICLGFTNLMVASFINTFILNKRKLTNIIVGCFSIYIVYIVKSYIIISILPLFIYFITFFKIKNIQSNTKKFLIKSTFLFLLLVSTTTLLVFTDFYNKISSEIISDALTLTAGQQNSETGNDSKYELGITFDDIKNKNIIPFIIPSINVALFRPFIWEVNKPLIIFSFLESCFFLFFTVYVFAKGKIIRTLSIILSNELLVFSLLFSIIFAFFVGLVSANFGTLIRYKTPFISYFLLALFIINSKLNENKSNSK